MSDAAKITREMFNALQTVLEFCAEKNIGYGGWYTEHATALSLVREVARRIEATLPPPTPEEANAALLAEIASLSQLRNQAEARGRNANYFAQQEASGFDIQIAALRARLLTPLPEKPQLDTEITELSP